MDPHRSERLAETLREELEEIVNYELEDPRLGTVTVTEVILPAGMRTALVRVALEGDSAEKQRSLEALTGAQGFIRRLLANRMDLYRTPELHFECDLSPGLAFKTPKLLKRIRKGRPREDAPENFSEENQPE